MEEHETHMLRAIKIRIVVLVVLIVVLIICGGTNSTFFHIGPSTPQIAVNIFGCDINTWTKWFVAMIALFCLELVNTWCSRRFKRWYGITVINLDLTPCTFEKHQSLTYIGVWKTIDWLTEMTRLFLVIVNRQIQFLLPMFLAGLIVNLHIDHAFLSKKELRRKNQS